MGDVMRSAPRTAHYTVRDPDLVDDEYLPSGWHDYPESKGIGDEEIYKHWSRFKNISAWPFQRKLWTKYIEAVIRNRRPT